MKVSVGQKSMAPDRKAPLDKRGRTLWSKTIMGNKGQNGEELQDKKEGC
jgi:hypothetical protein